MTLNREQLDAVENGAAVTLNVAGTECVLIRKDIFLRLGPDHDSGTLSAEEMNLLADEAEAILTRSESHGH